MNICEELSQEIANAAVPESVIGAVGQAAVNKIVELAGTDNTSSSDEIVAMVMSGLALPGFTAALNDDNTTVFRSNDYPRLLVAYVADVVDDNDDGVLDESEVHLYIDAYFDKEGKFGPASVAPLYRLTTRKDSTDVMRDAVYVDRAFASAAAIYTDLCQVEIPEMEEDEAFQVNGSVYLQRVS